MLRQSEGSLNEEPFVLPDTGTLPPFANEKNRLLDKEIQQKVQKLARLSTTLQDQEERADAMQQHMKNVQQEIHYTQALVEARNREIETERHFKLLAERENGRLKQDLVRLNGEIGEISDKISMFQNNIYADSERVEKIRNDLKIGKEELEEWLSVQQEKEEDSLALEKYAKEDEHRMRELSLQIQKMVQEVHKKKNQLSQETTETQISQIELERTAENFRRLHQERQNLLQQWENAISTMKKRDEEIESFQQDYQTLKDEIREKQEVIDEKQRQLEEQNEANTNIETEILQLERTISKMKTDHATAKNELNVLQDELDMLKKTLHTTSNEIQQKKNELADLTRELEEKKLKLQGEQNRREESVRRFEEIKGNTMSLEQKNAQLQELLRQDETRLKELDRETKAVKETQFRKLQDLQKLKRTEKAIGVDIVAAQNALRNLTGKANKLDQEAMKQQSLLYNQAFLIQQLERKVRRAQGERSDEEKGVLLKKIEQLNERSEDWKRKISLLNSQYKKVQEDLRQMKRSLTGLEKERTVVMEQIAELNLYNDSATSQLAAKIKEKEEMMVDENILRLELRKLRSFLNARADNVLSLENRQAQLQLALQERSQEIEIHKEMLRAHMKTAEEERYSANAELRDRLNKIEKLKRKYEIIMTQISPEDGDEEHSQAYYIIRASQKKNELQREGDTLDSKIKRTEKEVRALENTLFLMNDRNEKFRQTLKRFESDQKDLEQKDQLEQQFKESMEKYKMKKRRVEELEEQLQHLEKALASLAEDESSKLHEVADIEARINGINQELVEQERKRDRAHKHCLKLAKEWRNSRNAPLEAPTPEEVDLDIKETKDFNRLLMSKLGEVAEQHPEIGNRFQQLCEEAGIPVLSRPPSTARSRLSSRQSGGMMSRGSTPVSRSNLASPSSRPRSMMRGSTPSTPRIGTGGVIKTQQIDGSFLPQQ